MWPWKDSSAAMRPGQNSSAVGIKFDENTARESFQDLQEATNKDLDSFIDYYHGQSKKFKRFSILIRWIALIFGALAALSLNPIVPFFDSTTEREVYAAVTLFALVAAFVFAVDRAFSITMKYTDWGAFAYQLGVDKAVFNIALTKLYVDLNADALTRAAFSEARDLAQHTLKEFKAKRSAKKEEWASSVQSAMEALNKATDKITSDVKSASEIAVKRQEDLANEAAAGKVVVGLSIKVAGDDRGKEALLCVVTRADDGQEVGNLKIRPNQSASAFYPQGRYNIVLKKGSDRIASAAVTLDSDKTVEI